MEKVIAADERESCDRLGKDSIAEELEGKRILLTGATGMVGKTMMGILMCCNRLYGSGISVIAVGRDGKKARRRLGDYWDEPLFSFVEHDIIGPLPEEIEKLGKIDYLIHAASTTHPVAYATQPVATMTSNFLGAYHLLNYAATHLVGRFAFLSSVEVYGENRGDVDEFSEDYAGYIDCNTLRAGYPESKRASESLCQAYAKQYGIDVVIPRLSRTYGPAMQADDSKAVAQFIKKAAAGENIVLKSDGSQYYSYTYASDAAMGIFYSLIRGETGAAYNVADRESNITLKDLAECLAELAGTKVVFELPDAVERRGYSRATKAILNPDRLMGLGWVPYIHIREGLERTVRALREGRTS